jgi:hypothetical protein
MKFEMPPNFVIGHASNLTNVVINAQFGELLIILSKCEKVNKEKYSFKNKRKL